MSDGSPAPLQWRPMIAADLTAAADLSTRAHPNFPERPEVLAEKFRLFPSGCFVLGGTASRIDGYCFSHPWMIGPPPALDTLIGALPDAPDAYFIHDLTVETFLRRRNLASALVPQLVGIARSLPIDRMMLVAVSGSEPFWTRVGFRRMVDAVQAGARAKYGDAAVQMERAIG